MPLVSNSFMKLILTLTVLLTTHFLSAQKIIINGSEGNRTLVWNDFNGRPDESSPYYANTGWLINYKYGGIQNKGGKVVINGFEAILQLDPKKTWLKKGKGTDALLLHEQGHFDIALLCLNELMKKVKEGIFSSSNYNNELQELFQDVIKKYREMGDQYDTETGHSKNEEQQQKWNVFFKQSHLAE
jgi:hypothetical protein